MALSGLIIKLRSAMRLWSEDGAILQSGQKSVTVCEPTGCQSQLTAGIARAPYIAAVQHWDLRQCLPRPHVRPREQDSQSIQLVVFVGK